MYDAQIIICLFQGSIYVPNTLLDWLKPFDKVHSPLNILKMMKVALFSASKYILVLMVSPPRIIYNIVMNKFCYAYTLIKLLYINEVL